MLCSIYYVGRRGAFVNKDDSKPGDEDFFPRGAIAFFGVMIAAYGLIWLAIYYLLLHRQSGL